VHPAIDKIVEREIRENRRQGVKATVLEAAAILEAAKASQVDELWVIAAPEAAVVQRINDRPGDTEAAI